MTNRRYNIEFADDLDGYCEQYKITDRDRAIVIIANPDTHKGFETLLHECLHAVDWSKKEESVETAAKDISRLILRLYEVKFKETK